jgi:hypothetical protein
MSDSIKKSEVVDDNILKGLIKEANDLLPVIEANSKAIDLMANNLEKISKIEAKNLAQVVNLNNAYEQSKHLMTDKEKVDADRLKMLTQIAKAEEKLTELKRAESTELAKLKAEISKTNQELRANAKASLEGTEAYSQLVKEAKEAKNASKELGAQLKIAMRAGKEGTDEYNKLAAAYDEVTENASKLDKELKEIDKSVGDNFRNVGNYESAFNALNQTIEEGGLGFRDLRAKIKEYQDIAVKAGRTSPIGQKAIQEASKLQDELDTLSAQTKALADDGANLKAALQLGELVASSYQSVMAAQQLLGVESEKILEVMAKIQAVQVIINNLNKIRNSLDKASILTLKAKAIALKAYNFVMQGTAAATNRATIAMRALRGAMLGLGFGAVIAIVGSFISWMTKAKNATNDAAEAEKEYNEQLERGNKLRIERKNLGKTIDDQVKNRLTLSQEELKLVKQKIEADIKDTQQKILSLKTIGFAEKEAFEAKKKRDAAELNRLKESALVEGETFEDRRRAIQSLEIQMNREVVSIRERTNARNEGIDTLDNETKRLNERQKQLGLISSLIREETKDVKENTKENKKAIADLADLEQDPKDVQAALDARRKIQEEDLQRQFLQRRLHNLKTIQDDEEFNQAELDNEIKLLDELISLRQDYDKDVTDLLIQRLELTRDVSVEILEEEAELQKQVLAEVSDFATQTAKDVGAAWTDQLKIAAKQQEQIAANSQMMFNSLSQAAAEGNIEASKSLKAYQDEAREAQLRQIELEKRQQAIKQATAALDIFNQQIQAGENPATALANTSTYLASVKALTGSVAGFFTGTDYLGRGDGAKPFFNSNKDNYLIRAEGGERIVPTAINRQLGGITNDMLPELINRDLTGQTMVVLKSKDDQVINEIKGLRSDIRNQPNYGYQLEETLSGLFSLVSDKKTKNATVKNRYKA